MGYDDPDESGDEPGGRVELITPEDFLPPNPFPLDAQRMGFDRFTGDNGALLAVAANLDSGKLSHRVVAWLLLIAVVVPLLMNLWAQLT